MTEITDLAEQEIERTAEDAVREAVAEIGSELVYETNLRKRWEGEAFRLEDIATNLQKDLVQSEKKKDLMLKIVIGESVLIIGIVTGLLIYGLGGF